MYKEFNELPDWCRERLIKVLGGDMNEKVFEPVPALKNRTILDTMNLPDGAERLTAYLDEAEWLCR